MLIDLNLFQAKKPAIESITEIASGFAERTDPAALVIGPTGVGLSPACAEEDDDGCVLYVADSVNNRIAATLNPLRRRGSAGTGLTVSTGGSLNDPLGLTVAPNGHILVVNGNDGLLPKSRRGAGNWPRCFSTTPADHHQAMALCSA